MTELVPALSAALLAGLLACLGLGLAGWQLRARHAALGTALILGILFYFSPLRFG